MGASSSSSARLNKDEIDLLSVKTNMSSQEIMDTYDKFLEKFPKGKLNKKEFVEYFSGLRPDRNADLFCSQLFNAFDLDKNGKVDFYEFLLTISLTSASDTKQKLRVAFRMYDIDNDDKLSLKEIEKLFKGIQSFYGKKLNDTELTAREMAEDLLKKYDKDNNSFVTEDEFVNGLGNMTIRALDLFSVLRNGSL